LFNQDVSRKSPAGATDPVLKRREEVTDDKQKPKKRFALDEKPPEPEEAVEEEAQTVTKKFETSSPSPFNLLSGKKQPAKLASGEEEPVPIKQALPKDAVAITPTFETQSNVPLGTATPLPRAQKAVIEEMVKQMVKAVTEVKHEGKTETMITLQHPPLFAGAKITLTAFDTAKGEFNITFTNLSNEAKQLIDMQAARESLLNSLAEKGYVVHIVITTTQREEVLTAKSEDSKREEEENPKEGEENPRRQK
ncbi:MAG: hypothetical protein KDK48_04240, partial [Chlamydiia bacterium]|nr:hypothetical protein [Chlamydiia bacterium]